MIINFSVQNFGSIKDKQTLSFEADKSKHLEEHYVVNTNGLRLLKMALIYGANASGKSTVLNALEFLRKLVLNPLSTKNEELKGFESFLFDAETPKQNTIFAIEFLQNDIRYYYEIEFSKKAVIREELNFYDPNKANVYKRVTDEENQLTKITFGSKIKIDKTTEKILEANTLWNNSVLGGFLKTNVEIEELRKVNKWFKTYLAIFVAADSNLYYVTKSYIEKNTYYKADIINILKKADFNITDVIIKDDSYPSEHAAAEIVEEYKEIEIEHTVDGHIFTLPFRLESDGTKRYFGIASFLSHIIRNPTGISIDELESSLHPDLYFHFILSFLMNAKRSQLIATTHNREILNNKDIFRNDVIWFTDKSENCATKLYSLADFDSSVIRDTTNVLNAYKSGKLGATPHLGDYYIDLNP